MAPGNVAAHHFLTHVGENSGQVKSGLDHGAQFAKLAPEIPHARHMLGHNLRRAGRVVEAIAEFEAADRLHREYAARENPGNGDAHYALALAYQRSGRSELAHAAYERCLWAERISSYRDSCRKGWVDTAPAAPEPAPPSGE